MKKKALQSENEKHVSNDEPVLIIKDPMWMIAGSSLRFEASEGWLDSCVKNTTTDQTPISYRTAPADAIAHSIFG